MNSEKINIWELGSKINVKVKIDFIDLINKKIKEKFKTKKEVYSQINLNNENVTRIYFPVVGSELIFKFNINQDEEQRNY